MFQASAGGANFVYAGQPTLDGEDEPAVPVKGMDERRYLRNLHWVFRFAMAARDVSPEARRPTSTASGALYFLERFNAARDWLSSSEAGSPFLT